MQKERIHWIDIAKGIGIIFIIYAHELGSQDYRYLFYAFHIPLFLFLSGIVFKPYNKFSIFVRKSVKGLLIPYFIFALLSYFIWLFTLRPTFSFGGEEIKQFLTIFYANSNNGWMAFNNILWFLPTLFVTRIIFYLIHRFLNNKSFLAISLVIISIAGYLYSIFIPFVHLPFGTETAISAVVFYGFGYLWINHEKTKQLVFKYKKLLFPVLLIAGVIFSTVDFNLYGHQIDMRLLHLNNYFFFYLDAFAGIFAWIAFSMLLNKNILLEYLGKNSLILFSWHLILFYYFDKLRDILFNKQLLQYIKVLLPTLYTAASISVIVFVYQLLNNLKRMLHKN